MALYKFLRTGFKSENGDTVWKIGEWQHVKGKLIPCQNGLHCSKRPYHAFMYVTGEIIAEVEVIADYIEEDDKICARSMRVVRAWNWRIQDSVEFAVYIARLVLPLYEKEFPDDIRPRRAIEAAEAWLQSGIVNWHAENAADGAYVAARKAFMAANAAATDDALATAYAVADGAYVGARNVSRNAAGKAARNAYIAADAAYAAARAARAANAAASNNIYGAARAAYSAAHAASSTYNTAYAGDAIADGAVSADIKDMMNNWMVARISQLEEIEEGE